MITLHRGKKQSFSSRVQISKETSANFTSVSENSKPIQCKEPQSSSAIHGEGGNVTNIVNKHFVETEAGLMRETLLLSSMGH